MSNMGPPPPPTFKGKKQMPNLGPSSAPPSKSPRASPLPGDRPGTNHHLVICGAPLTQDDWIFGDFIGICNLLMQRNVHGRFLSNFPIEQWFAMRRQKRKQPVIKFGQFGMGIDPLAAYSEAMHEKLERRFFEQVPLNKMKYEMLSWMEAKAARAEAGDCVDIWILCHGNKKLGLQLGQDWLSPAVLVNHRNHFKAGVQVNMAFSACYSGQFTDAFDENSPGHTYAQAASRRDEQSFSYRTNASSYRIRNGRFVQGLVTSLAGVNLPTPMTPGRWNVADHEGAVKDACFRRISAAARTSHPQFYRANVTLQEAVHNVLFRDFVDVEYDPTNTSRRSRVEWPILSLQYKDNIDSIKNCRPDPGAAAATCQSIQGIGEAASAHPDDVESFDKTIAHMLEVRRPQREALNIMVFAVYWRARQQSTIWDLVQQLARVGALDLLEALEQPIFLYNKDRQQERTAAILAGCLSTFRYCEDMEMLESEIPELATYTRDFQDAVLVWLAIVLIRGAKVKMETLFDIIDRTGYLGQINVENFDQYRKRKGNRIAIVRDPKYSSSGLCPFNIYGWFLPKGGIKKPRTQNFENEFAVWFDKSEKQILANFNTIEENSKRYFGWPDSYVLLDKDQVSFFRRNATPTQIDAEIVED